MVLIEHIITKNCRLCHTKPGLHNLNDDKKLVKEIYDCVRVNVNDRCKNHLPHSLCEECKKMIKNFYSYKQHIRKVDQCLRKIVRNYEIKNNSGKQLKCEQCPAEFTCENIYKKHVKSHYTNHKNDKVKTDIVCPICEQNFENLEEYGLHKCKKKLQNELEDNVNSDVQIDCIVGNKDRDIGDEKTHKTSQYVCNWDNCNKILSSAYSLKTHELKHEGKRSFLCVTCGKGFITKNSLTCHEKIHLEVKGYICKLCNIGFSVRSNLRAREKKYHEGVRFYCSQCTKAFVSKSSLDRHERIHTGIKDFKCQLCPSAFYTKKELLKHQRYHQGLRSHKCDECFKSFFERHHLIIHLRSHTGERPYVCKFPNCGKSFAESQKLKRHHNAKHAQT